MSDHHNNPRLSHLRTTSQLLRQTTSSFTSHPIAFLFLSLLLFSFRSLVDHCSLLLTSFIDRDPSLHSLLSRLPLNPNPNINARHPLQATRHQHRRPPFLHLTRVGTLDDDFFSTDDDEPHRRSPFGFSYHSPLNGTNVFLSGFDSLSGFSRPISDSCLLVPQIIRNGVLFRYPSSDDNHDNKKETDNNHNNKKETDYDDLDHDRDRDRGDDYQEENNGKELERIVDFRLFIKGLELGRRDAATLFFLVSFLSAAYGWVILGFTAIYSWVLGVVFVTVINDLIGRFCSFFGLVWDGTRLGLKRVTGFILMRWAVRDALTQLLGLWYFGEIEDQYSFFRLFVRLKLMPFSVMSPWIRGFEKETSGFLFTWFLLDTFVGFIFAVDAWVAIVDSRRTGREIVKEGCYLISTMLNQAIQIKCFEAILCGSFARWVLAHVFGKFFSSVFQSAVEVYFMVAWLVFYLAARCKDAHLEGRRFGRRELEGLIDGLR